MKTRIITATAILLALFSCGGNNAGENTQAVKSETTADVKNKPFDELFRSIPPEEITENFFKLVGKDYTVITAGKEPLHNSMTASYGGIGILFEEPVTWCFLRANRYTLEVMKKENTYTMSYFPEQYKNDVLFFGSKSGRDSDKMKETKLTAVKTPNGDITYKEAKLVIECKLAEITTVNPDDFYTQKGRDFVTGAYDEAKDYHKLVFGNITNVWVKK